MAIYHYLIFTLFSLQSFCFCLDVLSGTAAGVSVLVASASIALRCKFYECCDDNWIHFDERRLEENIKRKLFGQHLAEYVVLRTLRGFYRNKNPHKALVMSFHGLTGSGKNYISSIIANSTYKEGTGSAYVHIYSGTKDFRHANEVSKYMYCIEIFNVLKT